MGNRCRPAAWDGLPVCPARRLPVPFSSGVNPDGTGRFGVNDAGLKLACALAEWCSVCGLSLDGHGPMVFLAIDHGADPARLLFTDPPAHEACAAASLGWCPFIAMERVPSRRRAPGAKPGWLWLAAAAYEMAPGRPPGVLFTFRPVPPVTVRRFAYHAGRLAEVTP